MWCVRTHNLCGLLSPLKMMKYEMNPCLATQGHLTSHSNRPWVPCSFERNYFVFDFRKQRGTSTWDCAIKHRSQVDLIGLEHMDATIILNSPFFLLSHALCNTTNSALLCLHCSKRLAHFGQNEPWTIAKKGFRALCVHSSMARSQWFVSGSDADAAQYAS